MATPIFRTKTVSTKVSEEEYAQLEAQAGERGVSLSEWCREVILAEVERAEAPSAETILAEVLALRMLLLNTVATLLRGETMTTEQMQGLIERVDRDKFRKLAERVDEQAARKKPPREKTSGDGNR